MKQNVRDLSVEEALSNYANTISKLCLAYKTEFPQLDLCDLESEANLAVMELYEMGCHQNKAPLSTTIHNKVKRALDLYCKKELQYAATREISGKVTSIETAIINHLALDDVLSKLNDKEVYLFRAYYVEERNLTNIAKELGMSREMVTDRVRNMSARVRRMLGKRIGFRLNFNC